MNRVGRAVLLTLFGVFFLFPLYAMADFSTRNLIHGDARFRRGRT